jgi:hypothetical protein
MLGADEGLILAGSIKRLSTTVAGHATILDPGTAGEPTSKG